VLKSAPVKVLVPEYSSLESTWKLGSYNDFQWTKGTSGVGYETAVSGFAVYNYVANVQVCSLFQAEEVINNPAQQGQVFAENAPVINYFNTGDGSHYANESTFPGLTMNVDQENFVVRATATLSIPSAGDWTFGVNSDDGFRLTVGGQEMAYPDPRGPGDTLQTFSFTAAGQYSLELVFYECGGGSEVELFAAKGAFAGWDPSNFRLVGDVANGGLAVTAAVVSGSGGTGSYRQFIATDLEASLKDHNTSAYLRLPFNLASPSGLQSLTLRMIRRRLCRVSQRYGDRPSKCASRSLLNSTASAEHPNHQALVFEEINVSDRLSALVAGTNVLAIQGLNRTQSDTDFLIVPELIEYRATNTVTRFFSTPTPGALNNSGFAAFVADTKFSVDRGFFETPFTVEISTLTEQATIRYTTDGSRPTLNNGSTYAVPLTISKTTVVRAAAFRDGYFPSDVDTQTYLFLNDVIRQSPNGAPPPGWPSSWGANVVDYGMDPDVVNNQAYSSNIVGDLKSIPTISIVTELSNLFDPTTGIYANPWNDGPSWERPASVELIRTNGTTGFQINAGLRIRGGYSRDPNNPKHAFRLFFRQEYGDSKLTYPMFAGQNGTDSFDGFDLRCAQNYSWSFAGDTRHIALRDQFSRDAQLAMGHNAERGDFYHLYLNGQYWGLYNSDERPEASYGESYFGGRKEDYDVVKVGDGYNIFATDGNMDAWTRLWRAGTNGFSSNASYFRIEGRNADGTPNPAYENLLDIDNLIDYMLVIFFGGNLDAPISNFLGNESPNNWYGIRNRTGLYGGFRFFAHDSEHTLLTGDLSRNRIGPYAAGDPVRQGPSQAFIKSNPQYIFSRLSQNAEFRLRVADHIQRHFFDSGVFTTARSRALLQVRSNEVYRAMVGESARWGDSKTSTPRTRNADWIAEMNRVGGNYLAQRPGVVLNQLRTANLYPAVAAPTLSQLGGNVAVGFSLSMTVPTGTVYYTLDGSDPRAIGGAVASSASTYTAPLSLTRSVQLKARTLSAGSWSALVDATFYIVRNVSELAITEIMYNPPGSTNVDGSEYEFIELKNLGSTDLELSGLRFTNGIEYAFPIGSTVAPGKFVVLVENPSAFTNRYPNVPVSGVYTGQLSNAGETIALVNVDSSPIASFAYDTRSPWPTSPDGLGYSLVPINPNANPDPANPLNWRASAALGGSPGKDDAPLTVARILINEVLTHTDPPTVDAVELYNPNSTNVDVSGWFLTDQREVPAKFTLPAGSVILAFGYLVFTESQWFTDPSSPKSFRLDSHGEQIYLYSANASGQLTGYSDGLSFGAALNGVSFGRFVNSVGDIQYPAQRANSFIATNSGPRIGPVVINEINYHPLPGAEEFIELKNLSNSPVKLYDPAFPTNTWRLNGLGFDFPQGTEIPGPGLLLLVESDPAAFRLKYGVPAAVQIFGPVSGTLQDSGEEIALQMPDAPDVDTNTGGILVPYIDVDVVRYNDKAPWPTNADGLGSSLEKLNAAAYGNDPTPWRASPGPPSPGFENTGNRRPSQRRARPGLRRNELPGCGHVVCHCLGRRIPKSSGRTDLQLVASERTGHRLVLEPSPGAHSGVPARLGNLRVPSHR
jgi:hypothetical protein